MRSALSSEAAARVVHNARRAGVSVIFCRRRQYYGVKRMRLRSPATPQVRVALSRLAHRAPIRTCGALPRALAALSRGAAVEGR